MTREQLEVFCLKLKEENDREREERNSFQMERDKIRTFWEITRKELEETKAKLRNKERKIEEAAEKNEEDMKFFKQKIKHLQYEHQNDLTECKTQSVVTLKEAADNFHDQEKELLKDKRTLKAELKENELGYQDLTKSFQLQHSEELTKARTEFETKAKEMEIKYEKKFTELKNELKAKHDMEISEVEERKNNHISDLICNHERAFNEMKNYYNDITLNNLALISTLKEQMEILRKQNERTVKQMADLMAENKRLAQPLQKALDEVREYKRLLENYEKDKISLANTKATLEKERKELEELRWTYDALELRFNKVQTDYNELHQKFMQGILEVQQKTAAKNVLLQKRVQTLTQVSEHREVIISELTKELQKPLDMTNQRMQEILGKKNAAISDLQYELARVCKAHDDLLETFEEKLVQYGIPRQELGFTPLRIIPEGQTGLAKGPAGLVTKNR